MRTTLLILFIFLSTTFHSQTSTFELYYGYNVYSNNYYHQLNTIDKIDIKKPFALIAVGMTEHLKNRHYQTGKIGFYIPASVTISDSLNFKTTGFTFDHNYSFDLIKNGSDKSFYLMAGFGYYTGQIYLTGNDLYKQKNPFFAPKLTIQPRFRIGKAILSLTFDYRYDISKGLWKNTKINSKEIATVSDFKQSGLTGLFSIGYCLN